METTESKELATIEDSELEQSGIMIDWIALTDGLHDTWGDWMPFLVFGMPYVKIADIFGIDKSTITNALKFNPDFAKRVSQGRKMVKRQLHYLWLDQKAVHAWKNIDYYLGLDPFEKDDRGKYVHDAAMRRTMFTEQAKMTKFVMQQLGLHVQRHEVMHHVPQPMFLGDETLAEHVIDRVRDIMSGDKEKDVETIAAEFRVITGEDVSDIEEVVDESEAESEVPYNRRSNVGPYN